jgi:hypothetical protein
MEPGEQALFVVAEPVVERADPIDDLESRTAELPHPELTPIAVPERPDALVPPARSGLQGWLARVCGVLPRNAFALLLTALVAALPTHFFVGRVDDTLIAAPALSDLAGGFGLLLLPLMWLAYFAVSALPLLIFLAGVVGTVLPASADGHRTGLRTAWSLVAYRLRTLWLWVAAFGLLAQSLPLLFNADALGEGVAIPLAIVLTVASTAALTLVGVLGCVVLVERGRGPRRALQLLSLTRTTGLVLAALAFTVLPRLADAALGAVAETTATVVTGVLWAVAALLTYAQARRAEGPVTSESLRAELAAPELF